MSAYSTRIFRSIELDAYPSFLKGIHWNASTHRNLTLKNVWIGIISFEDDISLLNEEVHSQQAEIFELSKTHSNQFDQRSSDFMNYAKEGH